MRKALSIVLGLVLLLNQTGFAQNLASLNMNQYIGKGAPPAMDTFRPVRLRYLSYEPRTDELQAFVDKGDYVPVVGAHPSVRPEGIGRTPGAAIGRTLWSAPTDGEKDGRRNTDDGIRIQEEAAKLMEYFRIGLALPDDKFWVNLRPGMQDGMIDDLLAQTDIGRILLAADVQLKKDTAAFTSPQTSEGKAYWDKLYKKAEELFGTEQVTIPTLTRPWIVPGEIILRQTSSRGAVPAPSGTTNPSAYIYKATLKVMLEEDYVNVGAGSQPALQGRAGLEPAPTMGKQTDPRYKVLNEYSTRLIRELILPKITRAVNSSRRYAELRQVYYSLVLARWFKKRHGVGAHLSVRPEGIGRTHGSAPTIDLIDSGKLEWLYSHTAWSKMDYFNQYQDSFKNGEYNVKETLATAHCQVIRSYISGGVAWGTMVSSAVTVGLDTAGQFQQSLRDSGGVRVLAASPVAVQLGAGSSEPKEKSPASSSVATLAMPGDELTEDIKNALRGQRFVALRLGNGEVSGVDFPEIVEYNRVQGKLSPIVGMNTIKNRLAEILRVSGIFNKTTIVFVEANQVWPSGGFCRIGENVIFLPEDCLNNHEKLQTLLPLLLVERFAVVLGLAQAERREAAANVDNPQANSLFLRAKMAWLGQAVHKAITEDPELNSLVRTNPEGLLLRLAPLLTKPLTEDALAQSLKGYLYAALAAQAGKGFNLLDYTTLQDVNTLQVLSTRLGEFHRDVVSKNNEATGLDAQVIGHRINAASYASVGPSMAKNYYRENSSVQRKQQRAEAIRKEIEALAIPAKVIGDLVEEIPEVEKDPGYSPHETFPFPATVASESDQVKLLIAIVDKVSSLFWGGDAINNEIWPDYTDSGDNGKSFSKAQTIKDFLDCLRQRLARHRKSIDYARYQTDFDLQDLITMTGFYGQLLKEPLTYARVFWQAQHGPTVSQAQTSKASSTVTAESGRMLPGDELTREIIEQIKIFRTSGKGFAGYVMEGKLWQTETSLVGKKIYLINPGPTLRGGVSLPEPITTAFADKIERSGLTGLSPHLLILFVPGLTEGYYSLSQELIVLPYDIDKGASRGASDAINNQLIPLLIERLAVFTGLMPGERQELSGPQGPGLFLQARMRWLSARAHGLIMKNPGLAEMVKNNPRGALLRLYFYLSQPMPEKAVVDFMKDYFAGYGERVKAFLNPNSYDIETIRSLDEFSAFVSDLNKDLKREKDILSQEVRNFQPGGIYSQSEIDPERRKNRIVENTADISTLSSLIEDFEKKFILRGCPLSFVMESNTQYKKLLPAYALRLNLPAPNTEQDMAARWEIISAELVKQVIGAGLANRYAFEKPQTVGQVYDCLQGYIKDLNEGIEGKGTYANYRWQARLAKVLLEAFIGEQFFNPPKFMKEAAQNASSSVGGIDLGPMNMVLENADSFVLSLCLLAGTDMSLPKAEAEILELKRMALANVKPAASRMLECLAGNFYRNNLEKTRQDFYLCLMQACNLEEESGEDSDAGLRQLLVLADNL